jgi:hypothetical protein
MDLIFPEGRAALREAAAAVLRAARTAGPHLAATEAEPIRWARGLDHHRRQLREVAQRLPAVNGTYMIASLLDHHFRVAAARARAATPFGGER